MTPLNYYGRRLTDKHPVLHYGAQLAAVAALLLLCWVTWSVRQLPERNCKAQNSGRAAIVDFIERQTRPALKTATPEERRRIMAYIADAKRTFHPLNCSPDISP